MSRNLSKTKKKRLLPRKIKENVGKPKELWKALKSLGLPSKITSVSQFSLKNGENISIDKKKKKTPSKSFRLI